jgi:hypothetical protein
MARPMAAAGQLSFPIECRQRCMSDSVVVVGRQTAGAQVKVRYSCRSAQAVLDGKYGVITNIRKNDVQVIRTC